MVSSGGSVVWLSKALAFSCAGRCSRPHIAAFPATCTWVHLVLPDPICAALLAAWCVGPAPIHDHRTEHALAWKVLYHVGIAGKAVVQVVPKALGEGRRSSPGSQRGCRGRDLPATVDFFKSGRGEVEDH